MSGDLLLSGSSPSKLKLQAQSSGGLIAGSNVFDPTLATFGWHIDVDFGWRVSAKFEIDLNFAWDVGQQALHYYQIEGECLQDITCDVGINPNDATCATGPGAAFGTIIAATDLSDLCNKMNERFLNYPIKWPIRKIRRSSRPVYTDVIDAEEAAGANHDCNTLEDQVFCHIPECFNFCFEKPDDAELGVEILLQDKFYTYVGSGELTFGGQAAASVDQGTDPDGGFELGGSATVIASHYNHLMTGNLILDGEFGVVSSAYSYVSSGELVLSGQAPVVSSAYNYRFRDGMAFYGSSPARMGINYKPLGLLELGGVTSQVVNYVVGPTSGGLTLGGVSPQKTDRYYFTASGGLELAGASANVKSSKWHYTPDSGLELSGFYKLKRRHTMDGGFTLAGDSIENQKLHHTMSGGVVLGGESLVPASSGWSWQSQTGLTLGGTGDTNYQNLGDIEAEAGSDTDFTDLEPVYPTFSDNPARIIQPETGAILTNCGCNPMPLTLKFNHNLNEGFLLKEFLIRNKLTLSSNLTITFNRFDNIWRRTLHFKGTGIDVKESWIILFEWGCTDEIGSVELDQSTWKLSIWVSRFLKDSDLEKTETRLLYTFPVETVCINNTVDYRFNIDTSSGEVVDLPENFNLADSIFNDDIGLFTGRFWTRNPNLELLVTELDFPVATPTKDIKPIFPEA